MWIKIEEMKKVIDTIEKLKEDVINLTIENDSLGNSSNIKKLEEKILNLKIENRLLRELLIINKINVKLKE